MGLEKGPKDCELNGLNGGSYNDLLEFTIGVIDERSIVNPQFPLNLDQLQKNPEINPVTNISDEIQNQTQGISKRN